MMPLIDENRIIVKHGLEALRHTKKPGLRALLDVSGVGDQPLNVGNVSFGIGPRLNAAGRIDETQIALDTLMLTTKEALHDSERASSLARKLNELNAQRREDQKRVQDEAFAMVAQQDVADARCLVICGENWSSGIVGLVAGKVVQQFHRPCVVIAMDGSGRGKGSARSIPGFHMLAAIDSCKMLLEEYGGHALAAGLSISRENVDDFAHQMNSIAAASLSDEDCVAMLEPAMEVAPSAMNRELLKEIEALAPFGSGNPSPLFVSRGVPVTNILTMGKEKEHLKFILGVEGPNYRGTIDAPWFYRGGMAQMLQPDCTLDLCYQPNINDFNGRQSVQFIIEDVNAPEW